MHCLEGNTNKYFKLNLWSCHLKSSYLLSSVTSQDTTTCRSNATTYAHTESMSTQFHSRMDSLKNGGLGIRYSFVVWRSCEPDRRPLVNQHYMPWSAYNNYIKWSIFDICKYSWVLACILQHFGTEHAYMHCTCMSCNVTVQYICYTQLYNISLTMPALDLGPDYETVAKDVLASLLWSTSPIPSAKLLTNCHLHQAEVDILQRNCWVWRL